jgi:hypothetical protein
MTAEIIPLSPKISPSRGACKQGAGRDRPHGPDKTLAPTGLLRSADVGPDIAAKSLGKDPGNFTKAFTQRAAHRSGVVGTDDVLRHDGGRMTGIMPDHAESIVPLAEQYDASSLGPDGFGEKVTLVSRNPYIRPRVGNGQ